MSRLSSGRTSRLARVDRVGADAGHDLQCVLRGVAVAKEGIKRFRAGSRRFRLDVPGWFGT
jgi:hypothetical protein